MPVTAIAQQLNKSHPEIHTITKGMEAAGYVTSVTDRRDKRKRRLALTRKGKEMVQRLSPVWQATERATEQWIRDKAPEFFLILRNLEFSLNTESFHDRVIELWKAHHQAEIHIDVLPMEEWPAILNHYRHFATLNLAVPAVEELLQNPKKHLINDGGQLFAYARDGQTIGTVAVRQGPHAVQIVVGKAFRRQEIRPFTHREQGLKAPVTLHEIRTGLNLIVTRVKSAAFLIGIHGRRSAPVAADGQPARGQYRPVPADG